MLELLCLTLVLNDLFHRSMDGTWDGAFDRSGFSYLCCRGACRFSAGHPISGVGGDGTPARGRCGNAAGLEVGVAVCADLLVCTGGICGCRAHAEPRGPRHSRNSQHFVPSGLEAETFTFHTDRQSHLNADGRMGARTERTT